MFSRLVVSILVSRIGSDIILVRVVLVFELCSGGKTCAKANVVFV